MKLSSFQLKTIALFAMTIDHIGVIFFPAVLWLRIVGRLAMPIFAFLVAEGFRHTKDVKKYALRLFVFSLLSMIPYYLAFGWTQNVLFSLLCGLIALALMEQMPSAKQKWLVFLGMCLISILLLCDWNIVGVVLVVGFYYYGKSPFKIGGVLLLGALLAILSWGIIALFLKNPDYFYGSLTQLGMLLSFPLLCLYNGNAGRHRLRWFFYAYYPLHLLLLTALHRYLIR